jgi:hypothetical protein
VSAVPTPPQDSAERLALDADAAERALCERIAGLLRPLARDGVDLHLVVHVKGATVSVKTEPPPRRWVIDGPRLRRQP